MIYVLRFENRKKGFFKVGISTKLSTRISDLQTACPFKLTLIALRPGGRKEEKAFHKRMDEFRTNGEWFKDTPETREILNIPDGPLFDHKISSLNALLSFMQVNKEYSFDPDLLCEAFNVDYHKLIDLYHRRRECSPIRIECVNHEDFERINYTGDKQEKYLNVIAYSEFFDAIFGGYERFNNYHSRITPFNKHMIPKKWLEPKYPSTYFFAPE
jgi:hypothetical protein